MRASDTAAWNSIASDATVVTSRSGAYGRQEVSWTACITPSSHVWDSVLPDWLGWSSGGISGVAADEAWLRKVASVYRFDFTTGLNLSVSGSQASVSVDTSTIATASSVSDHLADATDAHDASAISIADSANQYTATNAEDALAEVLDALQAHEADTTAAHAASAISYAGGTGMSATDLEAAVDELATEKVDTTRTISTTAPLTGGGDLSANRTLAVSAGTESAAGVLELATNAETTTGSDTARATHPAGVAAAIAAHTSDSSAAHAASAISYRRFD